MFGRVRSSGRIKSLSRLLHPAFLSTQLHERLQRFGIQKPAPIQDHAGRLAREVRHVTGRLSVVFFRHGGREVELEDRLKHEQTMNFNINAP